MVQAIAARAQQGGRLALVGECLRKDERNRPLIGERPTDGSALRIEASGDPSDYFTMLERVPEPTTPTPYRAVDGDGRLSYAINMRKTAVTSGLWPRPPWELAELEQERPAELPMSFQPLHVLVLLARQ